MAKTRQFDRDEAVIKARNLFWEKGYFGTSMRDLEAHLDLKPGSIYAAFGSKDGLYIESLDSFVHEHDVLCMQAYAKETSALKGLAAFVRAMSKALVQFENRYACMLTNTVLEVADRQSEIHQHAEKHLLSVEVFFTEAYQKAQSQGEISEDADPVLLAHKLHARLIGLRAYAQRLNRLDMVHLLMEDLAVEIETNPFMVSHGSL